MEQDPTLRILVKCRPRSGPDLEEGAAWSTAGVGCVADAHSANAVLVKVNQIGTLSEALGVVARARAVGWRSVASARSGETEDSFLADFAVGCGADQIKVGSVTRSSRLAKWNQLLRIEEDLPGAYLGATGLAPRSR